MGELIYKEPKFAERKHNTVSHIAGNQAKDKKPDAYFLYTPSRQLIYAEVTQILENQQRYHPALKKQITINHLDKKKDTLTYKDYLLNEHFGPLFGQRTYEDGPTFQKHPGQNFAAREGQSIFDKTIGKDLFNNQQRLARISQTAAEFLIWQQINNLKCTDIKQNTIDITSHLPNVHECI